MGMFLKMIDYGCLEVSSWVILSILIHMTKYLHNFFKDNIGSQ